MWFDNRYLRKLVVEIYFWNIFQQLDKCCWNIFKQLKTVMRASPEQWLQQAQNNTANGCLSHNLYNVPAQNHCFNNNSGCGCSSEYIIYFNVFKGFIEDPAREWDADSELPPISGGFTAKQVRDTVLTLNKVWYIYTYTYMLSSLSVCGPGPWCCTSLYCIRVYTIICC